MRYSKSIPPKIYQRLQCPYRESTVPSKINPKQNKKHEINKPIPSGIPPSVQKRLQNHNSTNNKYQYTKHYDFTKNIGVMQALSQHLSKQNRAKLSCVSKQYRNLDKKYLKLWKKVHEKRNKRYQIEQNITDHILKISSANVKNFNRTYHNLNFPKTIENFKSEMSGINLNKNILVRINRNTRNDLLNPILFHIINRKINPTTKEYKHIITNKVSKKISFENVVNMLKDKRRRNMAGNTPLLYILKLLVKNDMSMSHKRILEQYIDVLFKKNNMNSLNNVNIFGIKTMNLVKQLDERDMILRRIKRRFIKTNKMYNDYLYKQELKKSFKQ